MPGGKCREKRSRVEGENGHLSRCWVFSGSDDKEQAGLVVVAIVEDREIILEVEDLCRRITRLYGA